MNNSRIITLLYYGCQMSSFNQYLVTVCPNQITFNDFSSVNYTLATNFTHASSIVASKDYLSITFENTLLQFDEKLNF